MNFRLFNTYPWLKSPSVVPFFKDGHHIGSYPFKRIKLGVHWGAQGALTHIIMSINH